MLAKFHPPTCSRKCSGVLKAPMLRSMAGNMKGRRRKDPRLGSDNPAWKGGVTYFRKRGNYPPIRYVRSPEWAKPMARADGYIMEHRVVMAQRCGFLLLRSEVVHHLDHDPTRNAPSNLELWPSNGSHKAAEHGRLVSGAVNRWLPRSTPPCSGG